MIEIEGELYREGHENNGSGVTSSKHGSDFACFVRYLREGMLQTRKGRQAMAGAEGRQSSKFRHHHDTAGH
jgi:hypothetical protein